MASQCAQCGVSLEIDGGYFSDQGEICGHCHTENSELAVMGEERYTQGNFGLGVAAGVLGGILGLILVYLFASGNETKRGARHGFFGMLVFRAMFLFLASL